ncbi:Transposase associated domain-containing protein [Forsythia ovata]|uniref:Transposase associated domain-containing protein n=1 Tax=Forsythia ovata TaxID=205694 RepID=A0ABD1T988_9LAMI
MAIQAGKGTGECNVHELLAIWFESGHCYGHSSWQGSPESTLLTTKNLTFGDALLGTNTMDKGWVHMHPCTKEFDDGLKAFIEHAFAHGFVCASKVKYCKNMNDVNKEILYEHLICRGMMINYKVWHLHGEKFETTPTPETTIDTIDGEYSDGGYRNYIIDMMRDRFERPVVDEDTDGLAEETDSIEEDPERDAPLGTPATRLEIFKKTHTRKDKTPINELAKEKMDQMKELADKATEEGSSMYSTEHDDIFTQVMGPDSRGRKRCFGRATFPRELSNATSNRDNADVRSLKEKVVDVQEELKSTKEELKNTQEQFSDLKSTTNALQDSLKATMDELAMMRGYFRLFLPDGYNVSGGVPTVNHFVHNQDQPNKSYTTERAKKSGKANACSGKIFVTVPLDHFGLITAEHDPERNLGILVGESWEDMMECSTLPGLLGSHSMEHSLLHYQGVMKTMGTMANGFFYWKRKFDRISMSSASDAITSEMESARFRLYHKEAPVYD